MRTVVDLIGLAVFMVVALWIALVMLASPERRPVIACAPVHYALGLAQRLVAAGAGAQRLHERSTDRSVPDRAALACVSYIDRYERAAAR